VKFAVGFTKKISSAVLAREGSLLRLLPCASLLIFLFHFSEEFNSIILGKAFPTETKSIYYVKKLMHERHALNRRHF